MTNRYEWRSWAAKDKSVEADEVIFESTHVTFWNRAGGDPYQSRRLVLAVREVDCNNLRQVTPDA